MTLRWRLVLGIVSAVLLLSLAVASSQLPTIGAGGLLHPGRHRVVKAPPPTCQDVTFAGEGVTLKAHGPRAPYSDLRTVATERAPFFFTSGAIGRAFQLAEERGRFQVDAVSPVVAAAGIRIPVLLLHGAADTDTPPDHSTRVLAALGGPKRLILVPGARHNESLGGEVWAEIERWLEGVLGPAPE